jgi:hypothetical protein
MPRTKKDGSFPLRSGHLAVLPYTGVGGYLLSVGRAQELTGKTEENGGRNEDLSDGLSGPFDCDGRRSNGDEQCL